MAMRRDRAPSASLYSVICSDFGSILAILLLANSQKKGTPLLFTAVPYGWEFVVGGDLRSTFPLCGSSRPTKLPTCTVNHMIPLASKTAVCGSSALPSGILYSVTAPVCGSSLPMYALAFPVNQILPLESATSPCGPESSIFSAYSLKAPVFGSTRPILFCICSVNHSAPSPPTAGSCGCAPLVGTSHSLMVTFSSLTVAGNATAPGRGLACTKPCRARKSETRKITDAEKRITELATLCLLTETSHAPAVKKRGIGMQVAGSRVPMVILPGSE